MRARGGPIEETEAELSARKFGASASELAALRARLGAGDPFEVWPENWETACAFLAVTTQWRAAVGLAGVVYFGLDYAGARAGIEAAGIAITPELWRGLRVMEIAACDALNNVRG